MMLAYMYEEIVNEIDCYNIFSDLEVKGLPYDILKLFEETALKSLIAYSPFPNKLTLAFLIFAIKENIVELYEDEKGICWLRLKEKYQPKDISINKEKLEKGITEAKRFYSEIISNPKGEYYQDLRDEYPKTYHEQYLKELFGGEHFPYVRGYKYLVVGDDEGKSLALYEITQGQVDITMADIDERIPNLIKERIPKIKTKTIDTRLIRNKVWDKFDVVISYSLLNSQLNTLKDFLIGTTKDYGIVYMSMYPALLKKVGDIFTIWEFFADWGFWITHFTPYFVRMVKIPELIKGG